jgi:hypothetical protein
MYTYQQTQVPTDPGGELWTTGRYSNGRWLPESDWATEEEARDRAASLNVTAAPVMPGTSLPEEWPAGDTLVDFPRTYERIRRENQEEYHRLMKERIDEIQADLTAQLPKG